MNEQVIKLSDNAALRIKEIMSNCVPQLKIPFDVDAEMGSNWGEVG